MASSRLSAEELALDFERFLRDDKETLAYKCGGTWPINYCHKGEISYHIGETHFEMIFNQQENTYALTVINNGETLFSERKVKYSLSGTFIDDWANIFHKNVEEARKEFGKSTNSK